MKDIESIEDIKKMVDLFYDRVNQDEILSQVFNNHSHVNWATHLEKMYQFWATILLNIPGYKGTAFAVHQSLPVQNEHFEHWISLFEATVKENFEGKIADDAIRTANQLALTFRAKLGLLK